MSSPKKRIVPEEGGKSPVTQLNSVVLPAPLEPSTARRSPGRTVIVTSVSAASAPNIRVTPRNSSAAPAPTTERRWATLSMTAASVWTHLLPGGVPTPALPQADDAVRRPEHDNQEADANQQAEAVAVEPDMDQEVERKGAQDDEDQRADERSHGSGDATDDGNDQNVDAALDRDRARRDLAVIPDLENTTERSDKGRERIGRNTVRVDVETQRRHPPRIVAHPLQGKSEWRAREIEDREIAQRRGSERHVVEGNVGPPVDAQEMRGGNGVDAGVAVEDGPVLVGEIIECRADRERDHDGVDAFSPDREGAAERAEGGGQRERDRRRQPPRPAEADIGAGAHAEYRDHVAGEPRD